MLAPLAKAQPAAAPDGSAQKAAMGALEMARHFYKQGNYPKAAELFHQAYGFDPLPDFLFNAARAEQRAFMLDESERDFRKFLTLKGASEQAQRRANTHLKEIGESRSHYAEVSGRKAEQAKAAALEEEQSKAAALKAERARAAALKAEQARKAKASKATVAQVEVKSSSQAGEWKTPVGWAGLGLGVAAFTTGALLWATAASDQSDLDDAASKTNEAGEVSGVDWTEYEERRLQNSSSRRLGVIALGAGAALAGAGAWLLWTAPEHRGSWQVQASPRRVALSWRF